MKKTKIISIIILLSIVSQLIFIACVGKNDFSVPEIGEAENNRLTAILDSVATRNNWNFISISDLKNQYTSGTDAFQITSNLVMKGYVVSSDKTGNYFREFYIQDDPTNPTVGIKIVLNLTNSYNQFNIGREVYISLKELYLGETRTGDGVTAIGGKLDGTEVDLITKNQLSNHLFRSENTEEITPKIVTLSGVNDSFIGQFVIIEGAHFTENLAQKPYVDATDSFSTLRKIEVCQGFGFSSILLETSTFAIFKQEILPNGGGTISGVISKTFNGDNLVLIINSTNDVTMYEDRCTPLDITNFTNVLLEENFETTTGNITITGWTNFNQEGTKLWRSYTDADSGSKATRLGSYRSGNASTVSWLITKSINLDATPNEFLSFETSNSFADGSTLEVFISTDWNENTADILSSNWTVLPATIVLDSELFSNWVHSSYVDLSEFSGNAHIGFKYTGSGNTAFDGTYELDNIKVISE